MPLVRLISVSLHARLDWLLVLVGVGVPFLIGASGLPAYYTWGAAAVGAGLNAVTNYPLGIVKVLPAKWHSLVEWTGPGIFIVGPWLLFPNTPGAWALTAIGVFNFTLNAVTNW